MKTYLTALVFFIVSYGYTQNSNGISRNIDIVNPSGGLMFNNKYDKLKEIYGSVHLFPIWDGNYLLQSLKGEKYTLNSLNYNLQTKKLESLLTKDSIFELKINNIDFITTSNNKYKVINEELYQELTNGNKVKFYKHFTVKIHDAFINPLTKSIEEPAYFEQKDDYFYFINDSLNAIKLTKKSILTALKDKEEEIKIYVSKNDILYNNEKDVIKIFNYYSTL